MLILTENRKELCFSNKFQSISIHSQKNKIMGNYENFQKSSILAEYDNPKKCKRAFGILINALVEEKDFFEMPSNDSAELNTQTYFYGRDNQLGHKRVGKTK